MEIRILNNIIRKIILFRKDIKTSIQLVASYYYRISRMEEKMHFDGAEEHF
jgi:hypothetical protein